MTVLNHAALAREAHHEGLADEALVALARQHDDTAVRTLIRRHNQRLFRAARSIVRTDAEAEDVVQETYVRAFTHLDSFRGESRLSTWLTRIALNEALGRMRRRRPTVDIDRIDLDADGAGAEVLPFPSPSAAPDPEAGAARDQIRVVLERAVDTLPDDFRTVFVLRDVEGLSIEETAEQLGILPQTIKTRLHRARRLMRLAIQKELGGALDDLFPFDGQRCVHMADRVLARLHEEWD
jgi:RNA polymerase sigma-70 factor (ECF subfamily)